MRKLLAVTMAAVLTFALAACGGNAAAPAETQAAASAETQAAAEAAPAAAEEGPFQLGVVCAQTGSAASTGDQILRGVQAAIDLVNSNGGVQGRQIELIIYDDQGTPEGAVSATTRLVEQDGVDAIIQGHLSGNIAACMDISEAAKVLSVGNGTGTSWTNCGNKYLFRGTTNANLPIYTMVNEMVTMGVKSAALIDLEEEPYLTSRETLKEKLAENNIELTSEVSYQASETDFTGHIAQMLATNPETVILYGNGYEICNILRQLRQQGFTNICYTVEAGANTDVIEVAGPSANGLAFGSPYIVPVDIEHSTSDIEKAFLEQYVKVHGEMPLSDVAYRSYDSTNLMCLALNNSADLTDREANRAAFVAITDYEGLAGTFDFSDESGDGLAVCNSYMILDQTNQLFDKDALQAWADAQ